MINEIEKVLDRLRGLGISYELDEHEAVFTIEAIIALGLNSRGMIPVNLFLRDASGKRHFLVIHDGEKQSDLKKLREEIGCSRLSFGSEERLMKHLGLTKGSVSPFGLINNANHDVELVIDDSIRGQKVLGFHPNINTATVWITYEDFMKFVKSCGNPVKFVKC
ncbi:MAG: prolyl-tRNA synthetase associated domain-containing protein [Synergistaceae bacterium]|nr:prolyl-tRNA synthetase associated domain-containing protein [Synergistaceae bacterium]